MVDVTNGAVGCGSQLQTGHGVAQSSPCNPDASLQRTRLKANFLLATFSLIYLLFHHPHLRYVNKLVFFFFCILYSFNHANMQMRIIYMLANLFFFSAATNTP